MKFLYIISIFCTIVSCKKEPNGNIKIDLTKTKSELRFSDFVDSISNITLFTHDSCIISQITHLYIDGLYTILTDRSGNGISIFYNNNLINNIDSYGRGPQEFINITSFCLDKQNKHICIYDDNSRKILKFTYNGTFVSEFPFDDLMREFTNIDGHFICLQPAYLKKMRSGIWSTDSKGKFEKALLKENSDNIFEVIYSQYFNFTDKGISYYDRYDNRLLFITPDSLYVKYNFDLIPALPKSLKKSENKGLQDYFMLASFHDFENYLLMYYGSTEKFYQVLFHKSDSTYQVTENLIEDIIPSGKSNVSQHYIDNNTLAIELGADEDDYNLHILLLHIKN